MRLTNPFPRNFSSVYVHLPYTLMHLSLIVAAMYYLRLHQNSFWVEFSLVAYPGMMFINLMATALLKEFQNPFYRATHITFRILLICFIPFLLYIFFI